MKWPLVAAAIAAVVLPAVAVGATYAVKEGQLDESQQLVAGLQSTVTDLEDRVRRTFAFTVFFDPEEAPVNHAIFGPEATFTGQMVLGEVTITDPQR